MPPRAHSNEQWTLAKDAYLLGADMREISAKSGISKRQIFNRAKSENWPRPSRLECSKAPAALIAKESFEKRGALHRERIASLVEQALAKALPPALESWADIERVHKLGLDAFGLNQAQAPLVSIAFPTSPALQSTEAPSIIDLSTNEAPSPDSSTISLEAYPLHP